nr:complement C1q tumor necrosis factor-related protein 3-like [Crassostrea gigas]
MTKSVHLLLLSVLFIVGGTANETPQQVVSRYNNYKAICNGLGYKNLGCKDKTDTVAFQSSITNTRENMKNQETVIFDKVSLNEGKAYDKTTGIFIAPFEGIYSFTWTTLTIGGKYFFTEIVRNSQPIAYNHNDGRGRGGYPMSSSHANIKMKKGDKVWIRTHRNYGQYVYGANWCNFSGIKF